MDSINDPAFIYSLFNKPPTIRLQHRGKPWKGKFLLFKMPDKMALQITIEPWTEYREADGTTRYQHYEVRWPSCGGWPSDLTRKFASVLLLAAHEAAMMTKEFHGRIVDPALDRPAKKRRRKNVNKNKSRLAIGSKF